MKKIITLTTLCISALYTSLPAKVYDYTEKDYGTIAEYKGGDGKTLQVYNGSSHKIYVRIGYESGTNQYDNNFFKNCEFTGFKLNPGQTGEIYKYFDCLPINITGHFLKEDGTVLKDIPNGIKKTNINDTGTLRWEVYDNTGLYYRGALRNRTWVKQAKYDPFVG